MTQEDVNVKPEVNDSIQRCPHDKENPYAQISRALIRDNSISPECRWMLIYLLSMKDGWNINPKQLITYLKPHMGRTAVYDLIDEAMEAGYMKREEKKSSQNHGGNLTSGFIYYVSETPKFKKFLRRSKNRNTGSRNTGKGHIKEEHSSEEEHIPKKEHIPPTPKGVPADAGENESLGKKKEKEAYESFGSHVKLKPSELQALREVHGTTKVSDFIERVNDYCESKGMTYKSYAAAVRTFIRNDDLKNNPKPTKPVPVTHAIPKIYTTLKAMSKEMGLPIKFSINETEAEIHPAWASPQVFKLGGANFEKFFKEYFMASVEYCKEQNESPE